MYTSRRILVVVQVSARPCRLVRTHRHVPEDRADQVVVQGHVLSPDDPLHRLHVLLFRHLVR